MTKMKSWGVAQGFQQGGEDRATLSISDVRTLSEPPDKGEEPRSISVSPPMTLVPMKVGVLGQGLMIQGTNPFILCSSTPSKAPAPTGHGATPKS